jgi:hypothetical protein
MFSPLPGERADQRLGDQRSADAAVFRGPGTLEIGGSTLFRCPVGQPAEQRSAGAGGYADQRLTSTGPIRWCVSLASTAASCTACTRASGSSSSIGTTIMTPEKRLPEIRSLEKSKLTGTDANSGWSAWPSYLSDS